MPTRVTGDCVTVMPSPSTPAHGLRRRATASTVRRGRCRGTELLTARSLQPDPDRDEEERRGQPGRSPGSTKRREPDRRADSSAARHSHAWRTSLIEETQEHSRPTGTAHEPEDPALGDRHPNWKYELREASQQPSRILDETTASDMVRDPARNWVGRQPP